MGISTATRTRTIRLGIFWIPCIALRTRHMKNRINKKKSATTQNRNGLNVRISIRLTAFGIRYSVFSIRHAMRSEPGCAVYDVALFMLRPSNGTKYFICCGGLVGLRLHIRSNKWPYFVPSNLALYVRVLTFDCSTDCLISTRINSK